MKKLALGMIGFWLLFSVQAGPAFANKSSVSIEAPKTAQKGSEVTIKVTATHNANSSMHYTQLLRVTVNQKEVGRWEFSSGKRPEGEVFTREVKLKAVENMDVAAEASCNVHGSAGVATAKISVRD
jgi:desulfoferrodoxin (superoxide reductase-like protein)